MSTDLPPTYTQEPSESDVQVSDDSDHLSFVSAQDIASDSLSDADPSVGLASPAGPQIFVVPVADCNVQFQKGYLGADNERAAIEGELQIKSALADFRWQKVSVSLRTLERAHHREIELANTELILAAAPDAAPQQRSSFPFSIPLPSDTPQCLHTSRSALAHTLTATVIPLDESMPPLRRVYLVHTRRYTSHTHELQPTPETWTMAEPSKVEVQLPRTTFRAGEPIPIYITVPTPPADFVVEQGMRLRNLRAELVRIIHVKNNEADEHEVGDEEFMGYPSDDEGQPSTPSQKRAPPIPSTSRQAPDFTPIEKELGERKVVALSGASCRLHPSRPLRVRLVLHPHVDSPPSAPHPLPAEEVHPSEETECASITQSTLLHSVSFRLLVHATFMKMSNHTERVATQTIPLFILPPAAPLPEVEPSVDAAYIKKHDQPPSRTVRLDDIEVPQYSEAGPSAVPGAPPPFEEREAPPPFWSTEAEASTSSRLPTFLESEASTSRLPTFLESEREIYVPPDEDPSLAASASLSLAPSAASPSARAAHAVFAGEGTLFGFLPSEQFDGHADPEALGLGLGLAPALSLSMGGDGGGGGGGHEGRTRTPPPTLEMATHDADVTGLATMDPDAAGAAIEALGLALDQPLPPAGVAPGTGVGAGTGLGVGAPPGLDMDDVGGSGGGAPPPPPPPMDDPSDPPPSIDSAEFRAPGATVRDTGTPPPRAQSPSALSLSLSPSRGHGHAHQHPDDHDEEVEGAHGHAPPPYRVPHDEHEDHERVVHPPPYMDLVHDA